MTRDQLQQFARVGAQARLEAISRERESILGAFPDLGRTSAQHVVSADGAAPRARKRRRMSAAERRAVGKRMKAYWAKRRAEKGQTAKNAARTTKRKAGMSPEARKRQGERMKAYWAAKRATKVDGGGAGTQSETAGQNGEPTSAGRKQGRTK